MTSGNPEKPVITLLPAHYHNDKHFKFLKKELSAEGIDAIAPHLDISDPSLTRDDHAAVMRQAEEEKGAEKYVRAGLSWGGDLIYRELHPGVSTLVFMGAPLRPVLNRLEVPEIIPELANHPKLRYAAYVAGEREFNRQELSELFYERIGNKAVKAWSAANLEEHPHTIEDPAADTNAVIPSDEDGITKHYVGFMHDEIFDFTNQEKTARFFGMEMTALPTGHFAILEKPKMLAKLLTQIAVGEIDTQYWATQQRDERIKKLVRSAPINVVDGAMHTTL